MSSYVDIDQDARAAIEALEKPYGAKATALLAWLAEQLAAKGMKVSEVIDMCDDAYRWYIEVGPPKHPRSVGITIEISEAHDFGDDPEDGITFRLDMVKMGGEILGGLAPHNFTELCWVSASDPEQVAYRWGELETTLRSHVESLGDELLRGSECPACGVTGPGCVSITYKTHRCCAECSHPLELT